MVEDAVHHDTDSAFVAEPHEAGKVFIGAQTPVHEAEVSRVVAVGGRLKKRPDVDRGTV